MRRAHFGSTVPRSPWSLVIFGAETSHFPQTRSQLLFEVVLRHRVPRAGLGDPLEKKGHTEVYAGSFFFRASIKPASSLVKKIKPRSRMEKPANPGEPTNHCMWFPGLLSVICDTPHSISTQVLLRGLFRGPSLS